MALTMQDNALGTSPAPSLSALVRLLARLTARETLTRVRELDHLEKASAPVPLNGQVRQLPRFRHCSTLHQRAKR